MLYPEHIKKLGLESGISEETAMFSGVFTVDEFKAKALTGHAVTGISFPYYDLSGDILGHRIKLDNPLKDGGKYLQRSGDQLNLYFAKEDIGMLSHLKFPLFLTEGEKKALALKQYLKEKRTEGVATAIPGCFGWSYENDLGHIFDEIPFKQRIVYIIPDTDMFTKVHVWNGYMGIINHLVERDASVHIVDLRSKNSTTKIGIDDALVANQDVLKRIENPLWIFQKINFDLEPSKYDKQKAMVAIRKSILLDEGDIQIASAQISKRSALPIGFVNSAIKKERGIFFSKKPKTEREKRRIEFDNQRDGYAGLFKKISEKLDTIGGFYEELPSKTIVNVEGSEIVRYFDGIDFSHTLADIIPITPGKAMENGTFQSYGERILDTKEAHSFWKNHSRYSKLKKIERFSISPILVEKEDETFQLIRSPGYYEDLKVMYKGTSLEPSYSTEYIDQAFDYPFASVADKQTAIIAAIGSIFFRTPGMHPMIIAMGNQIGLGKSTFLKSLSYLSIGTKAGSCDYRDNRDEFIKELLAHVDEEYLVIDNIKDAYISSPTLERILTDEVVELRVIGTRRKTNRSNTVQYMASLNGGRFSPDFVARCICVFFDGKRKGEGWKNLLPFVKKHRNEILSEMIGMIEKWMAAGAPKILPEGVGRFENHFSILNGIAQVNQMNQCFSRLKDTTSRLDMFQSAFFESVYEEMDNNNKNESPRRSIKEITQWLISLHGNELFKDYNSTQAKYNHAAQRMSEMVGIKHKHQAFDEYVCLEVLCDETKSTKAGRKKYYARIVNVEKTPPPGGDDDGDKRIPGIPEEKPGIPSEHIEIKNEKGKKDTLDRFLANRECTDSNEGEDHSSSILNKLGLGILLDDKEKNNRELSWDTLMGYPLKEVSPIPDESWSEPQSGEYSYSFRDTVYPSKWWDGEDLGNCFSFDIETEVSHYTNIKLASAFNGQCVFRIDPNDLGRFVDLHKERKWICHNCVFDMTNTFKALGLPVLALLKMSDWGHLNDTLMLSKVISLAEGIPNGLKALDGNFDVLESHSLGDVSKVYLGVELPKEVGITFGNKIEKVSLTYGRFERIKDAPQAYLHYNAYDAISTFFLWEPLLHRALELCHEHGVNKDQLLSYHLLLQTSLCGGITSSFGMEIDQEGVLKLHKELKAQINDIADRLRVKGFNPDKNQKIKKNQDSKTVSFEKIMSDLERQYGIEFRKKFHDGMKRETFSQQAEDLESFSHIDFIRDYLEYGEKSKILSTFIEPLLGKIRIHSTYNAGMNSGRISSSRPNLQNIPRSGGIRELYGVAPGKKLVIADYSGAELHCAAQFAIENYGFSNLGDKLNAGIDVHRYVAAKYLGIEESEVTKAQRQSGKVMNFGRFGGSGAKTLMEVAKRDYNTDLSLEETKNLIQVWDTLFPEAQRHFQAANAALMKAWGVPSKEELWNIKHTAEGKTEKMSQKNIDQAWDQIARIVSKYKNLAPWKTQVLAQRPSLELAKALEKVRVSIVSTSGRIRGGCNYSEWCNNAALQGRQADITNTAWAELLRAGLKVVNVVHDEFIVECDEDLAEETRNKVDSIMLSVAEKFNPSMTAMSVESVISDTWKK